MSDREAAMTILAERYEALTGQRVHFELYAPSEVYAQRVKAAAQTNTLPDIFGVLGEKRDLASYIRSAHVADLTEDLKSGLPAWQETLFAKPLEVNAFEVGNEFGVPAGHYGIPIDAASIQMVYNKSFFRQAGLDPEAPPSTWEDFLRVCAVFRSRQIPCMVCGFGEGWLLESLASNWAMNLMGEEKVFNTYRGLVPYTDPDWVKLFSYFKTMADEKILMEGSVTMVNKMAEQPFANERAVFTLNGSWCVNVFKGMNPRLEYGATPPPIVSNLHPMKVWGGAGTSFMVNGSSPRRKEAVKFLRWLTADEQQAFLVEQTLNLPSNRRVAQSLPPISAQFADDLETATHPNLYPVHESAAVSEAFEKGIQSILIGEQSPEQVAQAVQHAKEKELAKQSLAA